MEPIIVEIKIYPEQEQIDSVGEKYTSKRYMAKFEDGQIIGVEQRVWPKDTGYEGYGGYLWHWAEEEWIEEAKTRYIKYTNERLR
jgi:hypothetical protein